MYKSYEEAVKVVRFERSVCPEEKNLEIYNRVFEVFQSLYPSYAVLSEKLSKHQTALHQNNKE
jgi:sugar (pentulose or hexulose) kinase